MSEPTERIAAVVLAAGESSRFGGHKLLAELAGEPVARAAVRRAREAGVDDVVVVLGEAAEAVRGAIDDEAAHYVVNPDYAEGMAGSIRTGIEALPPEAGAALIVLADQPRIPPDVIPALIRRYRRGDADIVVPAYRGTRANPVLFDRSTFHELRALEGDRGARDVVERDATRVAEVAVDAPVPTDVDTPADLDALRRGTRLPGTSPHAP